MSSSTVRDNSAAQSAVSRRRILFQAANGFGAIALQHVLAQQVRAAEARNPLRSRPPHFEAKAQAVIFVFNVGAPSSMDTFDPKPLLNERAGDPMPESFGAVGGQFTDGSNPILGTPWEVRPLRPERPAGFGAVPERGSARRRHLLRALVPDSQRRARAGDVRGAQWPPIRDASEHRIVGDLRSRFGVRELARIRGDAAARGHSRRGVHPAGAKAFSHPCIKEHCSGRAGTRSCTSTARKA